MVRIYSTPECPYCNELKEILREKDIKFVDVNVNADENENEFKKLYDVTKCDDVPMVKIDKQLFIPNISFKSISELVELIEHFN
jgi:glutaredoxin